MDVIGPDRLTITARKGEVIQLGGFDPVTDYWAAKGGCENVEYVRADLHAGAVSENERLSHENRQLRIERDDLRNTAKRLQDALTAAGGQ